MPIPDPDAVLHVAIRYTQQHIKGSEQLVYDKQNPTLVASFRQAS